MIIINIKTGTSLAGSKGIQPDYVQKQFPNLRQAVLMSKDFVKLLFIAIIIASPLAWWAMTKWLQDFVYRINIGWWVFVLSGGLPIVISLFTVSFQSKGAAMANPVNSLRSE